MILSNLRQGYFLSSNYVFSLISDSEDLKPTIAGDSEDNILVVISQDCDIVKAPSCEPYIEFIYGKTINEIEGSCLNGKNSRKLILSDKKNYIFVIHDKFRVKKEKVLSIIEPLESIDQLQSDNLDILKKWISKRYTRAAFPDEFNNRLSNNKVYEKLAKKDLSKKISYVLIAVTDEELPSDRCYEPEIIIIIPENISENEKKEIEELYEKGFSIEGQINPDIMLRSEIDVSIKELRKYKRWDRDSYSISEDAKPVDNIDTV